MTDTPPGLLLLPPTRFDSLRQALLNAGGEVREVSLECVHDKAGLLPRLAEALAFPPGIGHNWDSLADALTDLTWSAHVPCHALLFRHCHALQAEAPADFRIWLEILAENLDYWQAQGIALQIALETGTD